MIGARSVVRALVLLAAVALAGTVAACAPGQPEPASTPVAGVERLLELRAERSTDASAYAEVVADPQLAFELVSSARAESEATSSPTPRWEPPYESSRTAEEAQVVVVWVPDGDHEGWPIATVFTMLLVDGDWRAADAVPVVAGEQVPSPLD